MANGDRTTPLWRRAGGPSPLEPLREALDVDVAIVGAGISGLTLAALLDQAGRRVAVLEARSPGAGCTGHSTGHLSPLLDTRYGEIAATFGPSTAARVRRAVTDAIDLVGRLVELHRIPCGYRRMAGHLFTEDASGVGALDQEHEAARRAGLRTELVTRTPLPFPVRLALRAEGAAQIDPLAYATGLARSLSRRRVAIHPWTRVLDVEGGTPCRVHTARGTVRADAVVLATHSPIGLHVVHAELRPYSSYALAARLAGTAPPEGLFWDTADPYHYITRHTYADGVYVVVGGADHGTGHVEDTETSFRALEAWTRDRFPVAAITHRWSFDYFEPADGLPYVGRAPFGRNVRFATGFGGDGLVLGTVAARILADHLLAREGPYGTLFAPGRVRSLASARGLRRLVGENAGVARHLVGGRLARPGASPAGLAPGEGAIIEQDGRKVAAWRDDDGALHLLSPVCTHARCLVRWNAAERTWDCPCHGGRYTADGQVLSGPPKRPLARR